MNIWILLEGLSASWKGFKKKKPTKTKLRTHCRYFSKKHTTTGQKKPKQTQPKQQNPEIKWAILRKMTSYNQAHLPISPANWGRPTSRKATDGKLFSELPVNNSLSRRDLNTVKMLALPPFQLPLLNRRAGVGKLRLLRIKVSRTRPQQHHKNDSLYIIKLLRSQL